MGHVAKNTEDRYYVAIAPNVDDAIKATIDNQVPDHHRTYTQIDKAKVQELDAGRAYLVIATVLGADDRNDAGVLREHLARLEATYPNAAQITKRTVAAKIAELLNDEAHIGDCLADAPTVDQVLETAEADAELIAAVDDCFDPMTAAALDAADNA